MRILPLLFFFCSNILLAQSDTLNQVDQNRRKQGYWIVYGGDEPNVGFPHEGKIKEGRYKNNRKEGQWIKYFEDGITPQLIFNYKNNRPNGKFEKRYRSGAAKEIGHFSRNKYLGAHTYYFENGIIESCALHDSLGREIDSAFYNFPNGCRQLLIAYDRPGIVAKSIRYKSDSCNVELEVDFRVETIDTTIIYPIEPSIKPVNPTSSIDWKQITYKLIVLGESCHIEELTFSNLTGGEKVIRHSYAVRSKGAKIRPTAYNKLYNEDDEIFLDGEFGGGHFLNGKVYIYDGDGILLRLKVYKNGKYHSDGQL